MGFRLSARLSRGTGTAIGLVLTGAICATNAWSSSTPAGWSAVILAAAEEALPEVDPSADNVEISEEQVPAPALFDASASVVWDGRRTMKGVWIAHPAARSARRVRIFNLDTGAVVDGALFKAEPRGDRQTVVLSSDAANALEMDPKQKASLRIVALRHSSTTSGKASATVAKEVTSPDAPPAEQTARDVTPLPAPRREETASSNPVVFDLKTQTGAFTFETSEKARVSGDFFAPTKAVGKASDPSDPPVPPSPAPPSPAPAEKRAEKAANDVDREPPARQRDLLDSLFGKTTATGDGSTTRSATTSLLMSSQPGDAPLVFESDARRAVEAKVAPPKAPARVEPPARTRPSETISPPAEIAPGPSTANGPGKVTAKAGKADGDASAKVTAATDLSSSTKPGLSTLGTSRAVAAASAKAASKKGAARTARADEREPGSGESAAGSDDIAPPLSHPYVQVGLFRVAKNADRLAKRLRSDGIPVVVAPAGSGERPLARVVAGPFDTIEDRSAALLRLHQLDLKDAIPVRR